jgi:hypothetical protein
VPDFYSYSLDKLGWVIFIYDVRCRGYLVIGAEINSLAFASQSDSQVLTPLAPGNRRVGIKVPVALQYELVRLGNQGASLGNFHCKYEASPRSSHLSLNGP